MEVRFEDYYFSEGMRWTLLIILVPLGFFLGFGTSMGWFALILIPVIIFFFSTKYVTIVDTTRHEIKDLFYVFYVQSGKILKYHSLHSIKVDKERVTYNASSRSRDRIADYFIYTGTLRYDNSKELELTTKTDGKWFGSEMKRLAQELQIPIHRNY